MRQYPFYRPSDGKVGDVMPCFFDGRFHIYYLRFGVYGDDAYNEWSVRETSDFVHFSEDRRVGIYGGTGEIIPYGGKYHLFKEVEPCVIGHYTGETPYSFTDTGERLPSDDRMYVKWAWRDPKILWMEEEQCFWMLVATNSKTESTVCRHGCVGLCKSKDLYHWEYAEPLYAPLAMDGTYECPDLFRMGEWWYLVYSNANYNKTTHYVKGRSPYGPWQIPDEDTIDSFLFYAGRTASDGANRYIVAWDPERTGSDLSMRIGLRDVDKTEMTQYEDFAPFGYAGDMVVHRLGQDEKGDLTCDIPEKVADSFCARQETRLRNLQGAEWKSESGAVRAESKGGFSCCLAGIMPDACLAEMTVKGNGHEFGIGIGIDEKFYGRGLFIRFSPSRGRVEAVSALRDRPYVGYCLPFAVEQEMFVSPDNEGNYKVRILRDGELLCIYVNRRALSLRSVNSIGGELGFYAYDASVCISDVRLYGPGVEA